MYPQSLAGGTTSICASFAISSERFVAAAVAARRTE
jgi:hypothetical protein